MKTCFGCIYALLASFAMLCPAASRADAGEPLGKIHLGPFYRAPDNTGDTWAPVWTADGELYTPSNDSFGFHHAADNNIAFHHLLGNDPMKLTGVTVNPMRDYGQQTIPGPDKCTWKSSGCYAVDGAIYWVIARHTYGDYSRDRFKRQTAANSSIIKSTDFGKTWTRSAEENYEKPMFPGHLFATPYFIEYGRDGQASVDNADRYVYALSNNGFWDNGDNLILGRVARSKIAALHAADWQFYRGGNGMEDGAWTPDLEKSTIILDAPGKLGMNGATYVPGLNRYLMIGWYYPAGSGKLPSSSNETVWDFYESPKPWGPWTKISSHRSQPQGHYCPQVCPKFSSRDGRRLFVMTGGDFVNWQEYYCLTIVPLTIEPR